MNTYGEYATVQDTRAVYLSSAKVKDDALILSFIRQVSIDIDNISHRNFYPVYETRYYNTPGYGKFDLEFNGDLISLTGVINGNGDVLLPAQFKILEYNALTKHRLRLLPTVDTWKNSSVTGYSDGAVAVTGIWGTIHDRTAGWQWKFILATGLTGSSSSFSATPGIFFSGMIIGIDDELLYVTSIVPADPAATPPTTIDTVNIERAINGSVAAVHALGAAVGIWSPGQDIKMLTAAASVAYYNLKSNPLASSYTVDGVTFTTPKDVAKFIDERLRLQSLIRTGVG
jgi:hypothetical protein